MAKIHDLECTLVHQTEKAVLVTVDGKHKAWLPKSLIEIEVVKDDEVVITAPEALLVDKELL